MEKRNLRVSALAEGLSAIGLVLAIVTVISPYWGRFSNEGSPNSGGNDPIFLSFRGRFYMYRLPVTSVRHTPVCWAVPPPTVRES